MRAFALVSLTAFFLATSASAEVRQYFRQSCKFEKPLTAEIDVARFHKEADHKIFLLTARMAPFGVAMNILPSDKAEYERLKAERDAIQVGMERQIKIWAETGNRVEVGGSSRYVERRTKAGFMGVGTAIKDFVRNEPLIENGDFRVGIDRAPLVWKGAKRSFLFHTDPVGEGYLKFDDPAAFASANAACVYEFDGLGVMADPQMGRIEGHDAFEPGTIRSGKPLRILYDPSTNLLVKQLPGFEHKSEAPPSGPVQTQTGGG